MGIQSILDKQELTTLLTDLYGLNENFKVTKINRGSASILKIDIDNQSYILKEFQEKYKKEDIQKEIDVIAHLKKKGLPVPSYLPLKNGKYFLAYKNRVIIMQEFIEGNTQEQNSGTHAQIIESATYLGKIVKALEDFPYPLPGGDVSSWYSEDTCKRSINKYEALLLKIKEDPFADQMKEDMVAKIEMLKNIKKKLNKKELGQITYKKTHGDYSVMQFIYRNDKISSIIDFASTSTMPIAWEIARSYSYIDTYCKYGNFYIPYFIEYVKKVNQYISLNQYDLKYMIYLYLIQMLHSDYGYKQYVEDRTKTSLLEFAFLRTKMCKYLYHNEEMISNSLTKEICLNKKGNAKKIF